MRARMSVRRPGAGSSTSVRSTWRAFRSLRYWTSSAWQRRHASTWRTTRRSAISPPSTMPGSSSATSSHRTGFVLPSHGEQALPQLLAGPVEADLGGCLGDAELLGDLVVREVVDVAEDDDG